MYCYLFLWHFQTSLFKKLAERGGAYFEGYSRPYSCLSTSAEFRRSWWWISQRRGRYDRQLRKVKGHTLDIATLSKGTSLQKCSAMAHVVEGFHSFTCTTTRLSMNGMNHTCLCLPSRSWSSFTDPSGMEGWVSLGTTTVSEQSAQDCYVTAITVVSCSNRDASLGNTGQLEHRGASNSQPLGPQATTLTTELPSHPAVTELPLYLDKNRKKNRTRFFRRSLKTL